MFTAKVYNKVICVIDLPFVNDCTIKLVMKERNNNSLDVSRYIESKNIKIYIIKDGSYFNFYHPDAKDFGIMTDTKVKKDRIEVNSTKSLIRVLNIIQNHDYHFSNPKYMVKGK